MLHKEILKTLFGEKLRPEHNIADFDRVYFKNGRFELKNKEDLLDYILNFAGYYNLRLPNDRKYALDDIGMTKYINKKLADGSLLDEYDLNEEYGIHNAGHLLAHVERGVITHHSAMFLQTKYKPLFYQALLRDRLNARIGEITNRHPWKNDKNIKLRTTDDCMRYMMQCCISNELTIYDKPESACFINYLDKLHKDGRLLNGADIDRRVKVPRLGDDLLKQYWTSCAKKAIKIARNNNVYVYLPVDNLDDFLGWVQGDYNTAKFVYQVQKTFFRKADLLHPERTDVFERTCPTHRKNDITQVVDYCINFASFYNIKLCDFPDAPYSLAKIIDKKMHDGDLLTAPDIGRQTGINNQRVRGLLKRFGKTNRGSTLQFSEYLYLRSDCLDSFITGVKQYQFIKSITKLPDVIVNQLSGKGARTVPTEQLSKQKDVYSLTDQEMDVMATRLAQSNYLEERNAVNAMLNYMGTHVFSER